MSANLSIGEMLGIQNLAHRQIIRVSSEQLKMHPDISRHILKKRDRKHVGKAAAFGGLIAGFQNIRRCNCGIFPCSNEVMEECSQLEKAVCSEWPKIAMLPKVEGPFKITKEIRGDKFGC